MKQVTLIGMGAIGSSIFERMKSHTRVRISHVVVKPDRMSSLQALLGPDVQVVSAVPSTTDAVLECAGHQAVMAHVLPALEQGIDCGMLSIGALANAPVAEALEQAAQRGHAQLHLLSGAIAGIDALSAARLDALSTVTYSGRKPPQGWRGSLAESLINLDAIAEPTVFFEASAREAAQQFPKNANVAATLSLAGLGLDRTRVRLIADPTIQENIHEYEAVGAFGHLQVKLRGLPLPSNPKTSALTVLSALRYLDHLANPVVI
jgi:aspartate dehydrogenase